ncbi:hypothetical protein CBL_01349 [Carabus blaptoides fortunei]
MVKCTECAATYSSGSAVLVQPLMVVVVKNRRGAGVESAIKFALLQKLLKHGMSCGIASVKFLPTGRRYEQVEQRRLELGKSQVSYNQLQSMLGGDHRRCCSYIGCGSGRYFSKYWMELAIRYTFRLGRSLCLEQRAFYGERNGELKSAACIQGIDSSLDQ